MSSLSASKPADGRAEEARPGSRRRRPARPPSRRSSGPSPGRSRRRAGAPGRPRASTIRGRAAPRSCSSSAGEPTAIAWTAEQSSWITPGTVSSLVRAPPPIVVGGLDHRHPHAARGQGRRAASPFGPAPTMTAELTRRARGSAFSPRRRHRPRPGTTRTTRPARGPARDHVGDVDPALLDQPVGGVDDPVALALDVGRLGLEDDHAHVAGLYAAALLDGVEQLLAVEVPVAEVPAVDDVRDQLALADVVGLDVVDRVREQAVQGPPVRVHRPEGQALVQHVLGHLAAVEPLELLDHDRRRLLDPRCPASPRRRCSCGSSQTLVAQLPA